MTHPIFFSLNGETFWLSHIDDLILGKDTIEISGDDVELFESPPEGSSNVDKNTKGFKPTGWGGSVSVVLLEDLLEPFDNEAGFESGDDIVSVTFPFVHPLGTEDSTPFRDSRQGDKFVDRAVLEGLDLVSHAKGPLGSVRGGKGLAETDRIIRVVKVDVDGGEGDMQRSLVIVI